VNSLLPFLIFMLVIVGLLVFSARARRRQSRTQADRSARIGVGSDVMTTSGLYGTVVARNDDETVQISIAPGVEVKWALAALRDIDSLPRQYRTDPESGADLGDPASGVDLGKSRRGDSGGTDPTA
jgi:preprotein translocase subunit YajC